MTYPESVRALATGAFVPAITALHGHLSYNPADGHAWMYLGIAYSETGFQAESLRALERARLIMDDGAELDEAFGCTFLRVGDYEIARIYFESATGYTECPASVYRNLSILFLATRRLLAALGAIDTALEMDSDDILSLYGKVIILNQIETSTGKEVALELTIVLDDILRRQHVPPEIRRQAERLRGELEVPQPQSAPQKKA
jgi:tetratricopeptide (TPR) repeat protein